MFNTILVPVEFDESSDAATEVALNLAGGTGARVVLLHAYEPPPKTYAGMPVVPATELAGDISKAAHAALDAKLAVVRRRSPSATAIVREGTAWRAILDAIKDEKADLVVMGTHGRKAIAHLVLGSVAEKTVRFSPVPVLTVPSTPRSSGPA